MDSHPMFDILIIGSGPSGSHAAQQAVTSGRKVALLDIGYSDRRFDEMIPAKPFSEIRRSDENQRKYFLGDDPAESLRYQDRRGAHLTPARQHMIRNQDRLFPLLSDTFAPLQSTGLGGLGISWGANCFALEDFELDRIGIPASELRPYYDDVAREVGLSGRTDDSLTPLIANLDRSLIQPPLPLDSNAETILRRYDRSRAWYESRGFYLGQSLLAVLSKPQHDRLANAQNDMDFWADVGRSVYRPRFTLERVAGASNFTHLTGFLVSRFGEDRAGVTVECQNVQTGAGTLFSSRKLLLAAGAINSARLALASLHAYGVRLPILCNPNHWIAAINLSMLGRAARDRRHSLSQLTILMKAEHDGPDYVLAQVYSYRSLLMFRLLKDIPLPVRPGLLFLRLIATAFTCVNVHFPDWPSPDRWIQLNESGSGSVLQASCLFSDSEQEWLHTNEKRLLRSLVRLRCIPLQVAKPIHGASIHYAGTLPYAPDAEERRPFTTGADGRLAGTANVYVADGSTWRYMPAKGLTLTLMANARRVANQALRDLAAEDERAL
jgi:choline dehydrogenase-like flavoprotein